MEDIELSVMSYAPPAAELHALLREFELQHRVHVRVQVLSWEASWTEIMKYALYGRGPAVSEVGSTWVASLAKMNVLRTFAGPEVTALGGANEFLPAVWHSGLLAGEPTPWAIPWLADTRLLFYRRDLLRAAGVDEASAFSTHADLERTLEHLQAHGSLPWVIPTRPTQNTFHNLTSWVWGAGGDFLDSTLQRVTLAEPAARAGLRDYYGLHRFLRPEARHLDAEAAEALFAEGHAAATISGPWLRSMLSPQVLAQTGVALPPGIPYVSASHLVIWKHATLRHERLALELVRFLTRRRAQDQCSQHTGLLPVRVDALNDPALAEDALMRVMSQGVRTGRSFPAMRLWGLIEEKLSAALGALWARVLADPNPDLEALILAELEPLAQRLNILLQ